MATKKSADKTMGFEKGLKELEDIVVALEEGSLSLEESVSAYEKGMKLSKQLEGLLSDAQARITVLTQSGEEAPFTPNQEKL